MPALFDRCPTCGTLRLLSSVTAGVHGGKPSERRRRGVLYAYSADDDVSFDEICMGCKRLLSSDADAGPS
ncbi:MAG: hypothetical protein ACLFMT_07175, partial [Halobacteriales archaeon]